MPIAIKNADRFHAIINKWFGRAGSLPLTFILCGRVEARVGNITCLMEIISQYASRLHILDLHLDMKDLYMLETLALRISAFPLLQALTIGLPFASHFIAENIHIFEAAPALRQLTITECAKPSLLTLPWQHLTKFRGGFFDIEDCLEVLRSAPLLTYCAFNVGEETDHDNETVLHAGLQFFSLEEDTKNGHGSADILKYITLPSINTLRIADTSDLNHNDSFKSFISHSSPPLRTFSLCGWEELECLQCLMMITDLKIGGMDDEFEQGFLQLLANNGKDFLPNLQNLTFVDYMYPNSGYEEMGRSLCSRWAPKQEGVADLLSFRLVWLEEVRLYFDKATTRPLAKLVAVGTEIHIGPHTHNHFTFNI
ncbi:hypothetical protein C8R43DRAFT_1117003 [Mycena crocata]|nr:hypothetical protein C8R43DRAFT_1117003 [Mycena crocata]